MQTLTRDEMTALSVASSIMLARRPYFSAVWFDLRVFAAPGLATVAVDKQWRLYIDPEMLTEWSAQQMAGVLEHEIGHLLREHHARAEAVGVRYTDKASAMCWNIAGDAEINDDLVADPDVVVPEGLVTPEVLGMEANNTAEFYYENLKKEAEEENGGDKEGDPNGESGDESGSGSGSGNGSGKRYEKFDGCGSGSGGEAAPCEQDAPDGSGRSEAEQKISRRAVAEEIRRHVKARGDVPAGLQVWADQQLEPPKVNWRDVLRSTVRRAVAYHRGMQDYTWKRPNRREVGNVIRPSMHAPKPQVAIVIDTSGSMGEFVNTALSEVNGVIRQAGVRGDDLRVLDVDAQVYASRRVNRAEDLSLSGGGGTDMRVGIEAALSDKSHRPQVVVVLTDGYTPWPESEPKGVTVIAGIITDGREYGSVDVPSWMKRVEIEVGS